MQRFAVRQPERLLALIPVFALLATLLLPRPPAHAGTELMCNTMCTGGDCTVVANCGGFAPNTCAFVNESIVMASNAACTLGALDGMASAMGTMGTPATCSFYFANLCGATAMCTMGFFTTATQICVVDAADGLPVELMDFSINDGDGSPGDDSDS